MRIRRQIQEVGHCGPTCVSMLLETYGEIRTPREIAVAAGVTETIGQIGSRMDQLADAIDKLVPTFIVLGRFDTDLDILESTTSSLELALGVEWQGRFNPPSRDEFDIGHYSLVTGVDREAAALRIVDPDPYGYYAESGLLPIEEFEKRWWEDNYFPPGQQARSYRFAFAVVPRTRQQELAPYGFVPITYQLVRDASTDLSR